MIEQGLHTFASALSRRLRTIATDIEATRALYLHVAYGDECAKCRESIAINAAADVIDEMLTIGDIAALFPYGLLAEQAQELPPKPIT